MLGMPGDMFVSNRAARIGCTLSYTTQREFFAKVYVPYRSGRKIASSMSPNNSGSRLLSVAPMMDWTDRHYRYLARLMSRRTTLYTEMVVDQAIIGAKREGAMDRVRRMLAYNEEEHPAVLQLGGSEPDTMYEAVSIAVDYNYDGINLNCGCPSDKVAGSGCFGATLMLKPDLVGDICQSIHQACHDSGHSHIPVSVKCRIGVDDKDSYEDLAVFIDKVSSTAPVKRFDIHARKCILKGLTPAQNRSIPPLRYGVVYRLIKDFPDLDFVINGGIKSLAEVKMCLSLHKTLGMAKGVAGVMIGRAAYESPWDILSCADTYVHGEQCDPAQHRLQVLQSYAEYAEKVTNTYSEGNPSVRKLMKPLLGLFKGKPRSKAWRREVDGALKTATTVEEVFDKTLRILPKEVLYEPPNINHTKALESLAHFDIHDLDSSATCNVPA